ncbi:MAG TPA: DUF4446 family protein [Candidatus Paceibacterota bacterium]
MPQIDSQIIIYALIGLDIILILLFIRIEYRLRKFFSGKDGKSLEEAIVNLRITLDDISRFRDESTKYFKSVERRLKRSVQAVETIRFNPFKGTGSGGNNSFSTAILNEKGDGVVTSSMSYRDQTSIFSKPVKKFSSDFELTDEEKLVINNSKEKLLNAENN